MSDTMTTSQGNWFKEEYILPSARIAKMAMDRSMMVCPKCRSYIMVQLDIHRWCFEVDSHNTAAYAKCECAPEVYDDMAIFQKGEYYEGMIRCSRQEDEERKARNGGEKHDFVWAFERVVDRRLNCRTGESKGELPRVNQRAHADGAREAIVRRLGEIERQMRGG